MWRENTERSAIIISVGLHLLIALFMFGSKFELTSPPVTKLIEIINYGIENPAETGTNHSLPGGIKYPRSNQVQGSASNSAPDNINLPKSSSISQSEFIDQSDDQIAWSDQPIADISGNTPATIKSGLKTAALSPQSNLPESEQASVKSDDDFIASLRKRLAAQQSESGGYSLSGEITSREILNKVIPEYPEDLQQNSEVILKFEVNADGTLNDNIIITQKGGARLDQISMAALKKWRFNPISGDHVQTGMITFTYKLK